MSTRNRIPSAIETYLQLPSHTSLTVLTGTLGCSQNWLTALFAGSVLDRKLDGPENGGSEYGVLFVSWMRDLEFWKTEIRRTTGVDVSKHVQQNRFAFVDCFTTQYASAQNASSSNVVKACKEARIKLSAHRERHVVLILDAPDIQLATASATAQELNHMTMELRSLVHSTVLSVSGDLPLVSASPRSAGNTALPIEAETALFVTSQAHTAFQVMSVRELTSGAANDVSGVLQITRGGDNWHDTEQQPLEEFEALYLVQRDGAVKVFGRGTVH